MEEYISKLEVIDKLYDWSNHTMTDAETWHLRQVIGDIKSMPSAQPEPCEDAVSREAVLDMLHQECSSMVENFLKEKINAMLSVTPKKQRWIPVTLETLPNPNSVVVVCGKKGTWDYGTYRGWHGDIHSWWWKKNSIKHVYWWMYKDDAMSLPFREEGGQNG